MSRRPRADIAGAADGSAQAAGIGGKLKLELA